MPHHYLFSPSYHIQIYSNLTLVNHYSTISILPVPSSTSIPFEKPTFVTLIHKRPYSVLITLLSTSICTLFILAICIKSKLYTRCRQNSRQLVPNNETIDMSPVSLRGPHAQARKSTRYLACNDN